MSLTGRIALVTGAGVRLGRALALRLAGEGCDVAVHSHRSSASARETVDAIARLGRRAVPVSADLARPAEVSGALFDAVEQALGPVEILVNSAAVFEPGTLHDTDESHWDRHLAINLKAPFFLSREFVRRLPGDRHGDIVNLVDWRGARPVPGHDAYTVAKSGLIALTRLLAVELAPRVRVNAIAPGAILPPPNAAAGSWEALANQIPLRRTGSPDDVAEALVYLLRSGFVTGEVLHVTGGQQLNPPGAPYLE